MANFCQKCGAALPPETSFCSACGTPAAGPAQAASSVPTSQVPAYQASGAYTQTAVPSAAGGSGLKIVLIVVGVLIALSLLAVLAFSIGIWRVSRAVHATKDGITFSTSGGTVTAGDSMTVTAADLGVALYPGAVRQKGGLEIRSATGSMVSTIYSTDDPAAKVIDFYKSKLGDGASVMQTSHGAILSTGDRNKESTMITVTEDSVGPGKTKIMVMRTKK